MTREDFKKLTEHGVVYLDGAMGSNLYKAGMPRGVAPEGWILEHPEVVVKLQQEYVEAGSQIVYAPTFGGNRHNLKGYGLEDKIVEMNKQLVEISRRATNGKALIAGDLAPTGMMLEEMGGDDSDNDIFECYQEQAQILLDAGVDLFIIETMLCTEETAIAIDAIRSLDENIAIMATLTYQADGRSYYGSKCDEAVELLQELPLDAVGLNCSVGPDQLEAVVKQMKSIANIPLIVKPNAGMPEIDEKGNANYSMSPLEFASHMKKLVAAGAAIVGGCCGTSPEYIKAVKDAVEGRLIIR